MNDLISRKALIAEYDRVHIGPPGGARKLMEDGNPSSSTHGVVFAKRLCIWGFLGNGELHGIIP